MSAIISPCGQYRYRLERDCGMPFEGSKTFAYFGINPSTADATLDDATVRKWKGFTVRNGGHRFIVGNVFAFRSTDPKALSRQDDPFGPDWLEHLNAIIADADVLVPCWGGLSKMPRDLRGAPAQLLNSLIRSGKPVLHFGVTECGQPKHPLMLGYDTQLMPWPSSSPSPRGVSDEQRSEADPTVHPARHGEELRWRPQLGSSGQRSVHQGS